MELLAEGGSAISEKVCLYWRGTCVEGPRSRGAYQLLSATILTLV